MEDHLTRLDHMIADRRGKLDALRAAGIDPFPPTTNRTHTIAEATVAGDNAAVAVAGRLTSVREHGKTIFGDLADESGTIQLVWRADELTEEEFAFVKLLDPGDIIAASGSIFTTKTGQLSVLVKTQQVLAKAIRPIPRSWQDFENKEERFRKRYLDLQANPEVAQRFRIRAKIIQAIRSYYIENGFLEVDTPILQAIPGGASARPFLTHYNEYETDVYLRIAPELYLKRLLVGGYERVFEFARCFRNEGADPTHNPEFTQVENYAAYWDFSDQMNSLETMMKRVVKEAFGTDTLTIGGQEISFAGSFARRTFLDVSGGHREDAKFKEGTRGIIQPTFVTHHPAELIPLAKRDPEDPTVVQSFQLVIAGTEMAKGYSELNDFDEQLARFQEQESERASGNEEAQRIDMDYVEALQYGMPPASGLGVGIDRLVTLLTDSETLRETMLFPFMKPTNTK